MNKRIKIIALFAICLMATFSINAQVGMMGEVKLFAGDFPPRNWSFCDGQILSISSNQALFAVLGTTYGGDGRTTFALPDLRGRVAIGPRRGPGLNNYSEGQRGGTQTNTLNETQLPSHAHQANVKVNANSSNGTTKDPTGNYPAATVYQLNRADIKDIKSYSPTSDVEMNPNAVNITIDNTGGNQPINNIQPFLSMNYIICLQGLFPARQ